MFSLAREIGALVGRIALGILCALLGLVIGSVLGAAIGMLICGAMGVAGYHAVGGQFMGGYWRGYRSGREKRKLLENGRTI